MPRIAKDWKLFFSIPTPLPNVDVPFRPGERESSGEGNLESCLPHTHLPALIELSTILVISDDRTVPSGARAIALLFALCSGFLAVTGCAILLRPGTISMSTGAPLLFGLEQAGPYMFLLVAAVGAAVAWGLFRLNNIARRVAMLIAVSGIVMLVPTVSAATVMVQPKMLALGGLGIIVRVIIAWYFWREDVAEQFARR
jgi:hypothetical protein